MAKKPIEKEEPEEIESEEPQAPEEIEEIEEEDEEESEKPKVLNKGKKVDITDGARQKQTSTEHSEKIDGLISKLEKKLDDGLAELKGLFEEKEKPKAKPKSKDAPPKKERRKDMYGFDFEWDRD